MVDTYVFRDNNQPSVDSVVIEQRGDAIYIKIAKPYSPGLAITFKELQTLKPFISPRLHQFLQTWLAYTQQEPLQLEQLSAITD